MEVYEVKLLELNTSAEVSATVEVDEAESSENIIMNIKISGQDITSSNYNYLQAYQDFRDKLLKLGFGIKCNGSRINAVQSGMMGANDKMYLVEMGKSALKEDIVHIWDYADIDDFPDTNQQSIFFEKWVKR